MGDFKLHNASYKSWISKFSIQEKKFWQETTLLLDYQHCSSVLSLRNTDQFLKLQIRKHKYHFKWTSNSISPWIGNQLTAIWSLFFFKWKPSVCDKTNNAGLSWRQLDTIQYNRIQAMIKVLSILSHLFWKSFCSYCSLNYFLSIYLIWRAIKILSH